MQNLIGRRVLIVGTTSAGKTTLARALVTKLDAEHIELDALYWQQNWTPATDFVSRVEHALQVERWVVDGNYNSQVQPFVLSRADTVIWLDYSLGTKLVRLFRRTGHRTFTRKVLWNGNTETFRAQFFSRDSLFVWLFKTHWKQRRRYEALFCRRAGAPHAAEVLPPGRGRAGAEGVTSSRI